MNKALDYSHKMIGDLDKSLSEAREGLKKAQDDQHEMQYENVHLAKEYVNHVYFSYSTVQVVFQNSPGVGGIFHPWMKILSKQIHVRQEKVYGRVVILCEKSDSYGVVFVRIMFKV